MFDLFEQAFLKAAAGNPGRIKILDNTENLFNKFGGIASLLSQLFNGHLQITIIIDVTDNFSGQCSLLIFEPRQAQLPHQVIGQRGFPGQQVFIRRSIFIVFIAVCCRTAQAIALKIGFPIDI